MQQNLKSNLKIYKAIKQVFEIYKNYKFKLENQDLLRKSHLQLDDERVEKISDFIKLVDAAMRQLSKEERGILKMSFLDKVHYSECNCSQSTFFIKRKIACHKLYDLIFVKAQWHEIEQTFYSLKIN